MNYAERLLKRIDESNVVEWESKVTTDGLGGGENVRFVKGHPQEHMIGIVIDTTEKNEITVLLGNSTRMKVKLSEVEFRK